MFDDVTYTPAACDATLLGYNLYADDIKINDGLLKEAAYTGPGKKNTLYSVSAVYDKGESPLSEAVTMEGSESATPRQRFLRSIARMASLS